MAIIERLDKLKARAAELAQEIEELRNSIPPSGEAHTDDASRPLPSITASLSHYLALSPKIEDDTLLNLILQCAMHAVQSGGAGLTLLDQGTGKLVFRAALGDGSEGIIGYEVPLEGSQHGLAFATGEVQSSTPLHAEIETAAGSRFRNVLVAPLIVDGEGVGTMSAVNKQGADHFTSRDMETYKRFADLAAMVIRQRLREQALERSLKGDREAVPPELGDLRFGKDDALLLSVVQDIAELTQKREDLLPLIKRLSSLLLEISGRMDWGHWE